MRRAAAAKRSEWKSTRQWWIASAVMGISSFLLLGFVLFPELLLFLMWTSCLIGVVDTLIHWSWSTNGTPPLRAFFWCGVALTSVSVFTSLLAYTYGWAGWGT